MLLLDLFELEGLFRKAEENTDGAIAKMQRGACVWRRGGEELRMRAEAQGCARDKAQHIPAIHGESHMVMVTVAPGPIFVRTEDYRGADRLFYKRS